MLRLTRGWSVCLGSLSDTRAATKAKPRTGAPTSNTSLTSSPAQVNARGRQSSGQLANANRIPVLLHSGFIPAVMLLSLSGLTGSISWLDELFFFGLYLGIVFISGLVQLLILGPSPQASTVLVRQNRLTLTPIGAIIAPMPLDRPRVVVASSLAGVAVFFGASALLLGFTDLRAGSGSVLWEPTLYGAAFMAALGVINLIPLPPFLGARVAASLLVLQGSVTDTTAAENHLGDQSRRYGLILILASFSLTYLAFFTLPIGIFVAAMGALLLGTGINLGMRRRLFSAAYTKRVRDVMVPRQELTCLPFGATVRSVLGRVLRSTQYCFPVFLGRELRGFVDRDSIIEAVATDGPEGSYVSLLITNELVATTVDTPLSDILPTLLEHDEAPIFVLSAHGDFEGLLLKNTVTDVLTIEGFLQQNPPPLEPREDDIL